jgi:hypothetical protein
MENYGQTFSFSVCALLAPWAGDTLSRRYTVDYHQYPSKNNFVFFRKRKAFGKTFSLCSEKIPFGKIPPSKR